MDENSYLRFDDDNKTKYIIYIYILSIITRETGKLKTHSPIYCIMDNWENMLNLTYTLDKIYLTYLDKGVDKIVLITCPPKPVVPLTPVLWCTSNNTNHWCITARLCKSTWAEWETHIRLSYHLQQIATVHQITLGLIYKHGLANTTWRIWTV